MKRDQKRLFYFAGIAAAVAAGSVLWFVAGESLSPTAPLEVSAVAPESHAPTSGLSQPADSSRPQVAGAAEPGRGAIVAAEEPGEDTRSLQWDSLGPAARQQAMLRQLDASMLALRDGSGDGREALSRAEEALTVLRPELYATENGKLQHRELEAELTELSRQVEPTLPRLDKEPEEGSKLP